MKCLLLVLALVSASPAFAASSFVCDDLVGTWQGDRFDSTVGAQRTMTVQFRADAIAIMQFVYDNGSEVTASTEFAMWSCDSGVLVLVLDFGSFDSELRVPIDHYELFELNTSYVALRGIDIDCTGRYGDCGDIRYELIRLPGNDFEDCGC